MKLSKMISASILISFIVTMFSLTAFSQDEQIGFSSWYGPKFHGKQTASGELYDKTKYTAAHRTLPFGTMVKVTYLKTNKSILVRVNDRGPFIKGRIIDISEAAAREIGLVNDGVGKIKLEIVNKGYEAPNPTLYDEKPTVTENETVTKDNDTEKTPDLENPEKPTEPDNKTKIEEEGVTFKIQFAAFENISYAKEYRDNLRKKGLKVSVFKAYVGNKIIYKVLSVENFNNPEMGKSIVEKLKEKGFRGFMLKVKM